MCVCMCVIKVVIVDYGETVRVFFLLIKLKCVGMVLRILNLEEHQNGMIGSKVAGFLLFFCCMCATLCTH